jgi:outer membrane protein insertion porin family
MKSKHLVFLLGVVLFSACSNIKHLPDGDALYVGAKVKVIVPENKISKKGRMESDLEKLLRPSTNRKFLGMRIRLSFFNGIKEPRKEKGLRNWLKNKIGEPPVLASRVNTDVNENILSNRLENQGYFQVKTSSVTEEKNRKLKVLYEVTPNRQYNIASVLFPSDTSGISAHIRSSSNESLLIVGNPYNFETIKAERVRIDSYLKDLGYYYFNENWLIVQVDSTIGNHTVSLNVRLKDDAPQQIKQIYEIGKVYLFSNHQLNDNEDEQKVKAEYFEGIYIVDEENLYKPKLFRRMLVFESGEIYQRSRQNKSLNRLLNLGTFGFVSNRFRISEENPRALDTYYYLTPLKKKSIRLEFIGKTTSANFAGSEINLNRTQRNTFKGAERFSLSAFGGFDFQISGQNRGYNIFRFGTEAAIIWPKLLTPFKQSSDNAFVPRTRAMIGYEMQLRTQLYALNSFRGSYGYLWKQNVQKEHQLNALDISFVSPAYIRDEYLEQIALNPALARITDKQLIFGPSYTYTQTNTMEDKRNTYFLRAAFETAGNLAGLISQANIKKIISGKYWALLSVSMSKLREISGSIFR